MRTTLALNGLSKLEKREMACDINLSVSLTEQRLLSKLLNKSHRSFYETSSQLYNHW